MYTKYKMKLNATNRNTLTAIAIVFCLIVIISTIRLPKRSAYVPRQIETEPLTGKESFFDLESSLDCVPGSENPAYYANTKGPGGICGDQKWVKDQADAKIVGGIGGSLI